MRVVEISMEKQKGSSCRETTGNNRGCVRFNAGGVKFMFNVPKDHSDVLGRIGRIYDYSKLCEQKLRGSEPSGLRTCLNNEELRHRPLREFPVGFQDLSVEQKIETLKKFIVELAIQDEQGQVENAVQGVGCQSTSNQSVPHEFSHETLLDVGRKPIELGWYGLGGRAFDGAQRRPNDDELQHRVKNVDKTFDRVIDHFIRAVEQCRSEFTLKFAEMQDLKRNVIGINDGTGIIPVPKSGSGKFQECLAYVKQIVTKDENLLWLLKNNEQEYVVFEAECMRLRKELDDYNEKVTYEDLLHAPNTSCVRATEPLSFSGVPNQNCTADELPKAACRSNDVPCGDDDFLMADDVTIVEDKNSILTDACQNNSNTEDVGVQDCYGGEMQNDGGSTLHFAPEAMLTTSHLIGNNSSEHFASILLDSAGNLMPRHAIDTTMWDYDMENNTLQLVALNQHHLAGSNISKSLVSVANPIGHLDSSEGLEIYESANSNDAIYEPLGPLVPLIQNPHAPPPPPPRFLPC